MHLYDKRISVSLATAEFEPACSGTRVIYTEQAPSSTDTTRWPPASTAPAICLMPWELKPQPPMTGRFAI